MSKSNPKLTRWMSTVANKHKQKSDMLVQNCCRFHKWGRRGWYKPCDKNIPSRLMVRHCNESVFSNFFIYNNISVMGSDTFVTSTSLDTRCPLTVFIKLHTQQLKRAHVLSCATTHRTTHRCLAGEQGFVAAAMVGDDWQQHVWNLAIEQILSLQQNITHDFMSIQLLFSDSRLQTPVSPWCSAL